MSKWSFKKQETLFPKTIEAHRKKYRVFDEDGVEITDDYWDRQYGFDRSLGVEDKKKKKSDDDWYADYRKSGQWYGYDYYHTPKLSYAYVQQMAITLGSQNGVKVRVGNGWSVDLETKTLTYSPTSLMYGTKGELLATLLHEIGKLIHSKPRYSLKSEWLDKYKVGAYEALLAFEDYRVDNKMISSYPSAPEVYESAKPAVTELCDKYHRNHNTFKTLLMNGIKRSLIEAEQCLKQGGSIAKDYHRKGKAILRDTFGAKTLEEAREKFEGLKEIMKNAPTIWQYLEHITAGAYGIDRAMPEEIKHYVEGTLKAMQSGGEKESENELLSMMGTEVYPHIEDLLRENEEGMEALKDMFGEPKAKELMEYVNQCMETRVDGNGKESVRGKSTKSGTSSDSIPPEWMKGDYAELLASVQYEISDLIRRLTFIKRSEETIRYMPDQKRGKLHAKKLYKVATRGTRVFKKKLPTTDTISSFAFSLVLDVSWSMYGDMERIVHSTRSLILLSEVFKKMSIPFEIITFDDGAKTIKTFDQEYDPARQKSLAGIIKRQDGGSSNLWRALEKSELHKRPENNKVQVLLTDGGVGDPVRLQAQYFMPNKSKYGMRTIGFGIATSGEVERLCPPDGKDLTNASELPEEFAQMLKRVIKK